MTAGARDRRVPLPAPSVTVQPFGDRGWLIEPVGSVPPGWALELAARAERAWPQCVVIPGLASLLIARTVTWDGSHTHNPRDSAAWPGDAGEVLAVLSASPDATTLGAGQPRAHVLPARYDGPDLAAAAELAGVTRSELIRRHVAAEWTVAAVGFSPGFGYLTCPDAVFASIGRRDDPRPRVPAGAIAVAAGMCAVYPSPTPGGWQLIGATDSVLWDPSSVPPAQLHVGDVVRFEVA